MQNPHKDFTTSPKSPPPPDPTQTVAGDVAAAEEGGSSDEGGVASSIVRVVDPTHGGGDESPAVGGAAGGGELGGSAAVAMSVEGGGVMVVASTAPEKQWGKQKRKSAQLSDPPPWPPKCNECGKQFISWKAAFGHMRAHPDRDYRGFFRPPTSSSSSPRQRVRLVAGENMNTGVEQGGGEKGGSSSATGGVGFDLNQPTTEEEVMEASGYEAAQRNQALDHSSSSAGRSSTDEENKIGFDLNQLPPCEDDHDHQHKP